MNTGSWINRLVGKRDMMKTLSDAVDKYAPIVFSGDNFLTKESRLFCLTIYLDIENMLLCGNKTWIK